MNKLFTNAVLCGLFVVSAVALTSCGKSECDKGVCKEVPAEVKQEVAATEAAPVAAETVATTEATPAAETVATAEQAPATTETAA